MSVIYSDDDAPRRGLIVSDSMAAICQLALLELEERLMERADVLPGSLATQRVLSRTRAALAQVGRSPQSAWRDRCRYLDRQAAKR